MNAETLKQIANSVGGLSAGELASKQQKQELCDLGYVFPKFGGNFRLTPAGKRYAESQGFTVAPFATIPYDELVKLCEACWDSEWDKEQGTKWLEKAQ